MKKGIVFSFESMIALLFFATILFSINYSNFDSLKELMIVQQENDLLKIWSIDFPNNNEMVVDAMLLFENFDLFLNENKIHNGNHKENGIGSEAILLDNELVEQKIRIVVYFN